MADTVIERERTFYYYSFPGELIARAVNAVIGIIEFMLLLRFLLQLLGASPASDFIAWVYGVTDGLMGPFAGAFPTLSFITGGIDLSVILAMIGYAIIGWIITRLLTLVFAPVEII